MLGNVVRGFSLVQGCHDPEGSHYRKEAAYKMPPSILSLRGWLCQPKQSRGGAGDCPAPFRCSQWQKRLRLNGHSDLALRLK